MTDWTAIPDQISGVWAAALWRASWQGGIAILAIYAALRLLPRLTAPVQNALWRLAHVKLWVSLLWAAPIVLPLLPAPQQPATARTPLSLAARPAPPAESPVAGRPASQIESASPADLAPRRGIGTAVPQVTMPGPAAWLLLLWLVGVAVYAGKAVEGIRTATRFRERCAPVAEAAVLELCRELCVTLGIRRTPRLLAGPREGAPLLMGLFRPAIVLPPQVLQRCEPGEIKLVLAHELAHLRRGDLVWSWLLLVLRGLFFFHPLVWWADHEYRATQETACDYVVLQTTHVTPAEYGAALLRVVELCRPYPVRTLPALGIAESFRTLKRRLVVIRYASHSARGWTAAGALLLTLAATSLVPWRLGPRAALAASRSEAAANSEPPLFDFEHEREGWFSRVPGATVTVVHRDAWVKHGEGALQWAYDPNRGDALLTRFQPKLPAEAKTLDFWMRCDANGAFQLWFTEADGSVYHTHLRTPANQWQHFRIPLSDLMLGEREDVNGRLDLDQVTDIVLQDLSVHHPGGLRLASRRVWLDGFDLSNTEAPSRRAPVAGEGGRKLLFDDFDQPVVTWAANTEARVDLEHADGRSVLRARYKQGLQSPSAFRITNHWDRRYAEAQAIEVVARASQPTELTVTLREFDGTFTGPEYTAVCPLGGDKKWGSYTLTLADFHPVDAKARLRPRPDPRRVWLMLVGDATETRRRGDAELQIDRIAVVLANSSPERASR